MCYFLWILFKWKFCFIVKYKLFFLIKSVVIDNFLNYVWSKDKFYWFNVCKFKFFRYVGLM